MKLPDSFSVDAMDRDTKLPIDRVAIVLRLLATHKNDYYVGPLITNQAGRVIFSREYCERCIYTAKRMFLMDYIDNLAECRPMAEISLHLPEYIEKMIEQYRASPTFWGQCHENATEFYSELPNVRNAEFQLARIAVTEKELSSNPLVLLYLKKRE